MQRNKVDRAGDSRLRIIFSDTVVSLSLTADATFEDVAQTLGEFPIRLYGDPVAIDVTLSPPPVTAVFH